MCKKCTLHVVVGANPCVRPKLDVMARIGKKRGDTMKAHRQYVKEQIKRDPGLMPVTRSFRITIMERAARDTRFRQRLLTESINQFLAGDLAAGKAMLRDYISIEESCHHETL
jgi:hypothetical protein